MTRNRRSSATGPRCVSPHNSRAKSACGLGSVWLTFHAFLAWQAQIKLEAFGFAVADATMALELDPNYIKASRDHEPWLCGVDAAEHIS